DGVVFSLSYLSITTPPLTQTAEAGTTVRLSVEATELVPGVRYQWFFNGNAILGATNHVLELPNLQSTQAGAYTVVVSDGISAVTNAPAMLGVISPVQRQVVAAIRLLGAPGSLAHVEYADTLNSAPPQWFPVSEVLLSAGPQLCFDPAQPLPAQRFYRAWQT